jgi:hypothetical protein
VICASAPDAQSLRRHSAAVPQESNAVTQFRLRLGRFARACRRYDGGRVADREQRVEVVLMDRAQQEPSRAELERHTQAAERRSIRVAAT